MGVSFEIKSGDFIGVIGINGAVKTFYYRISSYLVVELFPNYFTNF